jgi:hypothetical protein
MDSAIRLRRGRRWSEAGWFAQVTGQSAPSRAVDDVETDGLRAQSWRSLAGQRQERRHSPLSLTNQ